MVSVLDRLMDPTREHEVFEGLARAKQYLKSAPIVLRAAEESPEIGLQVLENVFKGHAGWHTPQGFMDITWAPGPSSDVAFAGKTNVQYMRQAWKAPDGQDPDAGNFAVLSKVLSMEFLHRAVREQGGAYGGAANYDLTGNFSMMSYRDPRLQGTLDDFDAAAAWSLSGAITQDMVNSAIISACRALDAPVPLAQGAQEAWTAMRSCLTLEERQKFRDGVLGATAQSVTQSAQRLFSEAPLVRTAFINEARAKEASDAGLEVKPLAPSIDEVVPEDRPSGHRPK